MENLVDKALQDERCWTVYVHINKVNGKKYVGITSKKPESRWRENGNGYKGQPFYNAILKYGWGNFEHSIVASNLTCDEANEFEMALIKELDTLIKNGNGYNTTEGGKGTKGINTDRSMYTGENATHVSRVICLNNMKVYDCVKTALDEFKAHNIFKCCNGVHGYKTAGKDPVTGEKLTWAYYDETKDEEYYIALKEERFKDINHNKNKNKTTKNVARKVICTNTGEVFNSVNEANLSVGTKSVSQACRLKVASGIDENGNKLYWMYYEDYLKENNYEREAI